MRTDSGQRYERRWGSFRCRGCGRRNIGSQTHCLLCGGSLVAEPVTTALALALPREFAPACPYCGASRRREQKFCTECGKALAPIADQAPATAVCSRCRAEVRLGARFCTSCGTPLER